MDEQAAQVRILIGVGVDATGRPMLVSAVGDPVQAYGLLELAKDMVRESAKAAAGKPQVVAAAPGVNGQRLRITDAG